MDGQEALSRGVRKNILTPPVIDRMQFLDALLNPWLTAGESTRNRLPIEHPLVQSHLKTLNIIEKDYLMPEVLKNEVVDDKQWTIVGHVIDSTKEGDIEKMGGILGLGDDIDTFHSPEMLDFHLRSNQPHGGTYYVFLVPHWLVKEDMPHLPLHLFDENLKPEDLPTSYLKMVERHRTDISPQALFNETKIVPLTFCIGKMRI